MCFATAVAVALGNATATPTRRYEGFDPKIHAVPAAFDPRAEEWFRQADDPRERGDHRRAVERYAMVFEAHPT